MVELLLIIISLALVVLCGLFVAAEFSLIAVNRSTVERLAAKGDPKAKGIAQALTSLSTQLSSAQVGITITNLVIGFLAEPAIAKLIEGPLLSLGVPDGAVPGIAVATGLIIATIVTMVFGELAPKNIAIARPLGTAKFIVTPLRVFTRSIKYPIRLLTGSANAILRWFGVEPQEELASARSADELLSLVRRSAEKGTLAKETALMLERSLNFGDLTAIDVMTPRVHVKAVPDGASAAEVLELARTSGHSRFPVFEETLDNIVGVVHVKYAFGVSREARDSTTARQIMRSPVMVPSTIELEPLLEALRKGGLQSAVVIDEFGGMDGIVTIEDLLEELVGDVRDEHDNKHGAPIYQQADGSWLVSGLLRPDEIGEELGIFLSEEDEVETLAGLVVHQLEKIPKVGDRTELQAIDRKGQRWQIELSVERMDGNRIDRLRLTKASADEEAES
jgi:CBS domain containing-hemolysin-like protein